MKKKSVLFFGTLLVLSVMVWGCQKAPEDIVADGNYTQTELQTLLEDEEVNEIYLEGSIGLNRPLTVKGEKTLLGTGSLVLVGDSLSPDIPAEHPAYSTNEKESLTNQVPEAPAESNRGYALVVSNGSKLTIKGKVTLNANYAGDACLVEEGAELTLAEKAVIEKGVGSNIRNQGTLFVSGGSLKDTSSYHILNYGKMTMDKGEIIGSGIKCSAIYSTGDIQYKGGVIKQTTLHGIYLADGNMKVTGGQITACGTDNILVGKKASLEVDSSAVKISSAGRNGIYNLGTTNIQAGRFILCTETNVKNGKEGKMIINGGNFTDSSSTGIYNCGTMEVHGGNIATNKYGGIVNTGDLTMDGGALYANSGVAQLVNRSGKLVASGEKVTITSGKSVGIMNDLGGNAQITGIIMMDQQAAHIKNWGELYLKDTILDTNSTSSAVFNECGGHFTAENVKILDSKVHGIYNISGAQATLINVSIKNPGSRGIQNKGGNVNAKNLVVENSSGVAVGNDYDKDKRCGNITVDGLTVPSSHSGALINQCEGVLTVNSAVIQATEKTAIKIEGGKTYLSRIDLKNTISLGKDVTHAIYLQGGYLNIIDSTIANPTGCILQNKAGTVVGKNLTFLNSTNVAINNAYSDTGKLSGSITIDGLTVRGSKSGNLANASDGKTILSNAVLERSAKTNISAQKGSVVLNQVVVKGQEAQKSPCINIYGGAVVTMNGEKSMVTGGTYRAVSVGSSKEKGTFILNGGAIQNNGVEKISEYSGAVNVGALGIFEMNGGIIRNNVAKYGEQLYLATNAKAVLRGGIIEGREKSQLETIRLGGNNASLEMSGDILIRGVVRYNQSSAYIKVVGNLTYPVTIEPRYYNGQQRVVRADDPLLLANNCGKFALYKESIYRVGQKGFLTVKDGISLVAYNKIKDIYYASLQDAINDVPANGKETQITIVDNIALTESVIITGGRKIVLTDDKTAHTISRTFTNKTNNQNMMFYIYGKSALTVEGTKEGGLTIQGMGKEDKTNAKQYRIIFRVGEKSSDGAKLTLNEGVTVTGNYAESNGGVALVYGLVEMNGGTITGNETTERGGAFSLAKAATFKMNGGTIKGNKAGTNGGVVYAVDGSSVLINGGTITENEADRGGAIYAAGGGSIEITGGELLANKAVSVYGGNICIGGQTTTTNITGGTIGEGTAAQESCDIYIPKNGVVHVSGSASLGTVVYGDGAAIEIDGELTVEKTATIVPNVAADNVKILIGAKELIEENYKKFELAEQFKEICTLEKSGLLKMLEVQQPLIEVTVGEETKKADTLAEALEAIPKGKAGVITLKTDVTLTENLSINGNVTITSDNKVRTIKRAQTYDGMMITVADDANLTLRGATKDSLVIDGGSRDVKNRIVQIGTKTGSKAVFVMEQGAVLQNNHGTSQAGSAVYIYGTMRMTGGKITGNTNTKNSTVHVGGAKGKPGTFEMSGGEIIGNKADKGAGVYAGAYASVEIKGGVIKENEAATSGGGIFVNANAQVTLKEQIVIDGNKSKSGANLYVQKGGTITADGVKVSGDVKIEDGATVKLLNDGKLG